MILPTLRSVIVVAAMVLCAFSAVAENHLLVRTGGIWSAGEIGPRHSYERVFTCGDPAEYSALQVRVRRSEGLVLYLNGEEIVRSNVPEGPITPNTLASSPNGGADRGAYVTFRVPATALRQGRNVLAGQVHPSVGSFADSDFDAELIASTKARSVFITRGPYLQNATPDGITIRWRTDLPTVGRVKWGLSKRRLVNSTSGLGEPTTEHEIRIPALAPGTKFFYAIRSEGAITRGDTTEHSFRTLPVPGTDVPVRIWILGDSGTGGDGTARAEQVREAYRRYAQTRPADVWLMLGDNAYPYGSQADYQRAVFDTYPTFLRKMTLWSTLGNHETYSGEPNPYFGLFTFPTQGEAGGVPSGSEHYYSFDYGQVHFVCLDSQTSSRQPGSPMLTWLESDLSSTQAKWIIAFWHHPPYSRGSHNSDTTVESVEMRQNVLPILETFGVDLVFAGHSHSYERSMLIDGHYGTSDTLQPGMIKDSGNGKPKGDGPYTKTTRSHAGAVYTVCGVSGQVTTGPTGGTYDHPVMVRSLPLLGCMVLDVNGTRLNCRFLQANGQIGDSFAMEKP